MRKIIFYRSESGACPVKTFLDELPGKQAQKVAWVLRFIEEVDNVPTQYFKKLVNTENLWEVRVESSGNIFRLLGFLYGVRFVVLTHAFQKKTQKTPLSDIRLAEQRKTDYLKRIQ
jgi:phage-related protein